MLTVIKERRVYSDGRFQQIQDVLLEAPRICEGKACVYATGSFGRREACEHSDVDLFIVSLCDGQRKEERGRLTKLDEILLKADLIRAARKLGFQEFSKDGDYLQHHAANTLVSATGHRQDDATNTFTARLLLLLESRPLTATNVHNHVIDDVIAEYWREFPEHIENFMPAYLANDILRFWRTLCLNYEASTHEKTARDRAKRKIKNFKLKHSRMLTCYSALLFLLHVYACKGTVTVNDAREMVSQTPTQRIEWLADQLKDSPTLADIINLLERYEDFLKITNASEDDLINRFEDDSEAHRFRDQQSAFGDGAFKVLLAVGEDSKFYRRLVV